MGKILIKNGMLINEGARTESDILIEGERIARIDGTIDEQADVEIDATGQWVMPGMIDDQVHFREPGLTHKGDFRTESRSAVRGGVTSVMDMPNVKPATVTSDVLKEKREMGANSSLANYAFYMGTTNDNLDEVKKMDPNLACGVKIFMGASTGNMLVDDPDTLEGFFKESPILIATHCEDTPMILENEEAARKKFGEDVPMGLHPEIRSREACFKSSKMAVDLAKKHGTKLHVLHLTTADEMVHFDTRPLAEKQITAEVCVHHLWFDDRDYETLGSQIKCNPAVKTEADKHALRQALIDGKLDVIGTDHAPHTWEEKQNSYFKAPSGIPLVGHAVPMLMDMVLDGVFSLELVVEKMSHAVADRFQIKDRGYLREGYYADIAIVNPNQPKKVTPESIRYKCRWSPLLNHEFKSSVTSTIVSGNLAVHEGDLTPGFQHGLALEFDR